MSQIICICNESKHDCEFTCDRWKNTNIKPDEIFYYGKWPKEKQSKEKLIINEEPL